MDSEKRGMVASQNLLDLCFRKIIFATGENVLTSVRKLEACVQTRTVFYGSEEVVVKTLIGQRQ